VRHLLVDGNNLGWRGFVGEELTRSDGTRVEVVFLGLRMLKQCLNTYAPDSLTMVWDGGRDPIRKKLFPAYKEKEFTSEEEARWEMIHRQMNLLREVLSQLGVRQIQCSHREADDVLSSYVQHDKRRHEFYILSTDRDYYQLLTDSRVRVCSPTRGIIIDKAVAEEELGIRVQQYPFYKALVGGHDAIPGVPGIGKVRAAKVLVAYDGKSRPTTVSSVLNAVNREDLKEDFTAWVKISKFLTVPEKEVLRGVLYRPTYSSVQAWAKGAMSLFKKYEFRSFLNNMSEFLSAFGKVVAIDKKA
jgi:5'-3' exonuclease